MSDKKKRPKIGHLVRVQNTRIRHSQEKRDYSFVRLSDYEGIVDHLFTDDEVMRARRRAKRNPEDCHY